MKLKTHIFLLLFLTISNITNAISSSSISGKLTDKNTSQELPGAIIELGDTKLWTVADKYGKYAINNIPPGVYEIRARMLGYATIVMRNVNIRADYDHEINFEMVLEALELKPEIVIVAEKPLIRKDFFSGNHSLNFSEINRKLPIDYFYQTINMQPAAVNGHVRGGRKYDALYMVDGQSILDPMFREISTLVPSCAISDINIHSGGFNAEYGQAMSGVINLTTKEGKEKTEGFFKVYTDNLGLKIKNDNLRRMEMSLGGPLLLSFGGPMYDLNYHISGTMNFDKMQISNNRTNDVQVVPKGQNYYYTSKLSFVLWHKLKIVLQTLSSSWQFYRTDKLLSTLQDQRISVDQKKESSRINFSVIHTLNPKSFYTLNMGRDIIKKQMFNNLVFDEATSSDNTNESTMTDAQRNWDDVVDERIYFFKAIYYRQFAATDLIKVGVHCNFYRLFMNSLLLNPLPDSADFRNLLQQKIFDRLDVHPYTIALFAQNKIEHEKFLINFGLRFDYFNPNFILPEKTIVTSQDTVSLAARQVESQIQMSPRVGLSFPLFFKDDRIHLNYGLFFQIPPLYYFYLNSNQNLDMRFPLFGNPQLKAEKTAAFEIGYQKAIAPKTVLGATYFVKKIENVVNTRSYYVDENDQINYNQFENLDQASIKGVEIFIEKRPGDGNISGKISYSYCKAVGSGSFPEQNYYSFVQNLLPSHGWKSYPLAWDQRHKVSCSLSFVNAKKLELNLLTRINSPLPIFNQKFQIIDRGRWRNYLDFRLIKSYKFFQGEFSPYFEVLNLLNDQEQNRIFNPYNMADYDYWMSGLESYQYEYGRRVRIGLMINF